MNARFLRNLFRAVLAVLCCLSLCPGFTYASENTAAVNDGMIYPSSYAVGSGGSVKMTASWSDGAVVSGKDKDLLPDYTITGPDTGRFPDDLRMDIEVTGGSVYLKRIEITPAAGSRVESVLIKEGPDGEWIQKGKITSYEFTQDVNAFVVIFRQTSSSKASSADADSVITSSGDSASETGYSGKPASEEPDSLLPSGIVSAGGGGNSTAWTVGLAFLAISVSILVSILLIRRRLLRK